MAVCHLPAAVDRCVCALVASYGIGGVEPSGDVRGGVAVPGSGRGVAGSDMSLPFAVGGRRIAIGRRRVRGSQDTAPGGRQPCHRYRRARILARQRRSGTGWVSRGAALRASWASTIMVTAPMRTSSSG